MKKHTSKLIALVLALCLCLSLSVSAFAAEIGSSGGSGSTPVNLSSTSDGTEGGDPSATAMRVTVPTALPMAMSQDGDVTTANNCQIVNHSYGAVRVKSVSITAASGWKLTAFGNKSILAGEKVDSNKLGFCHLHRRRAAEGHRRLQRQHPDTHRRAHRRLLHDRRG